MIKTLNSEIHNDENLSLSPFGKLHFRLFKPSDEIIINCAMTLNTPIELETLKNAFLNSLIIKHPRFSSLLVRDHKGIDHWKKTNINIDDHIIIRRLPATAKTALESSPGGEEAAINAYLADIVVSAPLSIDKPLWEVHLLEGLEKCVVFRVHHGIGDGVSLMSMLSACFGESNSKKNGGLNGEKCGKDFTRKKMWREKGLWGLIKSLWFTIVFLFRYQARLLWVKDKECVISGGEGVELWPRKVVTSKFLIEDLKSIKTIIPKVTINDVILGSISSGLSKYLNVKSPEAMQKCLQLTIPIAFNLRKDPYIQEMSDLMRTSHYSRLSGWGNKFAIIILPIYCCNGLHPLDYVRSMKAIMDKKKHSYEAPIVYTVLNLLISYLGIKVGDWCWRRITQHSTLGFSNIVGPSQEISIAGHTVTSIRVNISSSPHAISMHMVSYAGKVNLQVMVAKDIVPDPEFLVKCFEDSFAEMKNCIKEN